MESQGLSPGKSVFWTAGLNNERLSIVYFDALEEALEELFSTIKQRDSNISKATVNYKTEDGEFLEIVHVQFHRYQKQKPFREWFSGWFRKNKEIKDE